MYRSEGVSYSLSASPPRHITWCAMHQSHHPSEDPVLEFISFYIIMHTNSNGSSLSKEETCCIVYGLNLPRAEKKKRVHNTNGQKHENHPVPSILSPIKTSALQIILAKYSRGETVITLGFSLISRFVHFCVHSI